MAPVLALRTSLAAALLLAGACVPAYAADDLTPRPQRVFLEKPRIEDYTDYNAFLVDIMEYRRQKQERAQAAATAGATGIGDDTLARVTGQEAADPTLYRIDGPESLDAALARAGKLPHPVYEEPERFGRTTSYSFPIPQMDGDDMSSNEIQGRLADLESINPDTFRDESAEELVDGVLVRSPSNEEKTREKKAAAGTDDAYQPSYDLASRTVTDSDGKTYWIPIYIENEIGYTVIRVFDISVETLRD
ncbi:MAG: hypothetical protein ACOY3X_08495 [Pseudomonadota bacterium]